MPPLHLSLALAFVAALANIVGGVIVTSFPWGQSSLRYFVALGSGFMLGTVFLEMVPESFNLTDSAAGLVLLGYLIVHLFEHTLASHLHFGEEIHHEEMKNPAVGASAFIGLLVHTFFDGVAIAAGFLVSSATGTLIFFAVLLHKIPDGFTVSSIVLSAGLRHRHALIAAHLLGLSTICGVVVVELTGPVAYALPLSAGATLYVAASDLIPEVNREAGVRMAFCGVCGSGPVPVLKVARALT